MSGTRPHVVIVGAGFAGLWAAKELANKAVDVTIVDRNNYHSFFPLLYQVAAAELQPADIAYPIRSIIRRYRNTSFRRGSVDGLDLEANAVSVDGTPLTFDYLIFGPGSFTNYFGVEGAEEHAFGLRTLDDGLTLRNHLLSCFERADATHDPDERARLLRFVVVGGGPTGVEFSGALQEFINGPFHKEFSALRGQAKVQLVEAGERLLPAYPDRLSAYAAKRLRKMGVDVQLGATVGSVTPTSCQIDGSDAATSTVVWTAGVGGSVEFGSWSLPMARGEKIAVGPDLSIDGYPNVFAAGDISHHEVGHGPMVCQNALQQGRLAARNILGTIGGKERQPFKYRDLGNMAVIGRNAAVVHLWNRIPLTGFAAWLIWLTLHLAKLVGFRNRLAALISWTGDYFFADRAARLIIPSQGGRS